MAKALRVLFVERSVEGTIGGSHHSLYQMIVGLMSKGVEPVVVFYEQNHVAEELKKIGCDVHFFGRTKKVRLFGSKYKKSSIFRLTNSFLTLLKFLVLDGSKYKKWLCKNDISLVHLNNNPFSIEWVSAAKRARIPCVAHQRGARNRLDRSEIYLANTVDRVVCISKYVRDSLRSSGCAGNNFELVYNGIDVQSFRAGAYEKGKCTGLERKEGRVIVGLVGNIKPWKGQHILIEALKAIVDRDQDVFCVFVGAFETSNTVYEESLKAKISDYGLSDRVLFTGYTPFVKNYMANMDIVVHASTDPEPFGRVIIEAMALEKPVIATRGGGASEILEHEVTGVLIAPSDPEVLASTLIDLINDTDKRCYLAKNAYRRVNESFSIDANVKKISEIYSLLM
ncbi:hypothetical protein DIT71_09205 [Marinobacter vulgaris]|uniref:Glycosyltransferase family 1 protein n=1 Tax=Marinobacter vulgaris TaxID=1928331 RepID=A0A2V3ZM23_9GAMM|nr:glycosyltransferase family 4 protein [Marinobacter vulgaris]PXX90714.1 hypothetical protein DIT71_09205 [Marinobacter vulgaris]TSJ70314.1 glycosyltransferase family 4 protein [Marinobacter vulgaris]